MDQSQDQRSPRDLQTYHRSRAVRLPDHDYANDAIIHFTLCAAKGAPFRSEAVARMVTQNVAHYCQSLAYEHYGFCLMPDHLHVLLSPGGSGVTVSDWLQRFKSYTGHAYVKLGGEPPLWQRSAHDHVCRSGETAETVLAYIAENPVRAGLVVRWQDWPWTRVLVDL